MSNDDDRDARRDFTDWGVARGIFKAVHPTPAPPAGPVLDDRPILGVPWIEEVRAALAAADAHPQWDRAEYVAGQLVNFVCQRETAAEQRGAEEERERIVREIEARADERERSDGWGSRGVGQQLLGVDLLRSAAEIARGQS